MDELRPDELAAVVAAWHNRHPLARRITPAQVQGVGWVALPFVQRPGAAPWAAPDGGVPVLTQSVDAAGAPAAGRLRDRAQARAQGQSATPGAAVAPTAGSWPQRLLAQARHGLQALRQAPVRARQALQAARQQVAQQRLRAKALQPAFSEDFIAPISPRQVAGWALRHGQLHVRNAGLPMREVRPDAAWGRQDTGLVTLYLATAAVELGSRRVRVLLPARGGATLGPRLLSPQRAAAALGLLAAIGLGIARPAVPPTSDWPGVAAVQATLARWSALAAGAPAAEPGSPTVVAGGPEPAALSASAASAASSAWPAEPAAPAWAEAPASASSAAAGEALPGAEPAPPALAGVPDLPASQALALASPRPGPEAPLGADPDGGAATLPPDDPPPPRKPEPFKPGQRLVPPLDEATKAAARDTVAALRAARGDPPPPPRPAPGAPTQLALAPNSAPPAPGAAVAAEELGPAFALTTRPLRTRAESEQVQAAVRALLAQHTAEPLLVELMPVGEDWRVVCWPFARKQDAQLARALLLTRGLRMEAIEF
jgi:hypothetical protein